MRWTFGTIALLLLGACTGGSRHRVTFHLIGGLQRHFVIEKLGVDDERPLTLDSGAGRGPRDSFSYDLPPMEPTNYQIRFQGKSFLLPFIYDSSDIDVFYNYTNGEYHFINSPASEEWKHFQQEQLHLVTEERRLNPRVDSSRRRLDSLAQEYYTRNFNFADTVRNPALFLLAYNLIEYGNDYKGLEQFIRRVGQRFPGHAGVQNLVRNTIDFTSIFGSPLRAGDTLPPLVLQDTNGRSITIGPVPGKYTLIDFWSTWCDRCRIFSAAKKEARRHWDTSRLAVISVAIDAKEKAWRSVINYEHYTWPQLIDEKMWSGPVARTMRFDSIPFNFLLGPDGHIIAKGIPADSLLLVIGKFVK
jgi:hypothetical protein